MNLKYRIREITFISMPTIYVAQYKILGFWLNINNRLIGRFSTPPSCYCDSYNDAVYRVNKHERDLEIASEWFYRNENKMNL